MNGNFSTTKKRNGQKIFGFDASHAFTGHQNEHTGNKELHEQIIPPNESLGSCMSWALGTNGTVFTANKLTHAAYAQKSSVARFTKVFANRVARSAVPSGCQRCECTGKLYQQIIDTDQRHNGLLNIGFPFTGENNGIAYVTCSRCEFGASSDGEDAPLFDDIDYLI